MTLGCATPATVDAVQENLHRRDPFERGIAQEGMKPIPPMIECLIVLAFAATLVACQLALISDLLLAVIILALLVVLVTTESNAGECDQPPTPGPSVLAMPSAEKPPAASRIPAASQRRSLGSSRRNAFPVRPDASPLSRTAAGARPPVWPRRSVRIDGHWSPQWSASD
jgi:hypothetical protein